MPSVSLLESPTQVKPASRPARAPLSWRRVLGSRSESAKVAACRTVKQVRRCPKCGESYAISVRCRSRWCPHCARVRSLKWYHAVDPDAFLFPSLVTLTLKAGPNLAALVALVLWAWPKWCRALKVKRYVRAVEVLPRPGGVWYVHLHALVDCVWLDRKLAASVWCALTGAHVLDVRRVSTSKGVRAGAVREVVKYATKGVDSLTPGQVDELGQACRGRHLVARAGCRCPSSLDTTGNKSTSEAGSEGSVPSVPCLKCGCQTRFIGFVASVDFGDGFDVPDYDWQARETVLKAVPVRAGPWPLVPVPGVN